MKTKIYKNKLTAIFALLILLGGSTAVYAVSANDLQSRIDRLDRQIEKNQSTLNNISHRRNTLENKLAAIDAEIAQLQAQITKTKLETKKTNQEIKKAEEELERQKQIMFENARVLYKQGDITTLEAFAASDSFGDFINAQEYLERVKGAVNDAAQQVLALKEELEVKKEALEQLALRQKAEENKLGFKRAEQQKLVDETRGEEAKYQQIVAGQRKERERLEAKQRAAYEAAARAARNSGQFVVTGGTGSYPWADKPYPCWDDSSCVDPWDLYFKECVSYTAWKVADSGRYVRPFAGRGNANEWPGATSDYVEQGFAPKKNAVAINMNIQPYGHAMYVEEVLDGGNKIRISEYNFAGPGQYSERIIPSSGLVYLYFQ